MKRILSAAVCLVLACSSASAWGRYGHATIAKIAENHLTAASKAAISEILDGESIVLYASYADENKGKMFIDLGCEPTSPGDKRFMNHPHTFEANMDFEPFHGILDGGRYVKNCIHFVEEYAADLKDWKNLPDSLRWHELVLLVHFVGDMHCPEHIRYNPEDMTIGYYNVIYKGVETRYHTIWDDLYLTTKYPWSIGDLAMLFDSASEEQIAEIVKGGPYDWGRDVAKCCWPVHQIKPGETLGKQFNKDMAPLLKSQIRKAGYRLAHELNMTFDAKYAKKHNKQK